MRASEGQRATLVLDNGPAGSHEDRVNALSKLKVQSLNPLHFRLGCNSERLQATCSV